MCVSVCAYAVSCIQYVCVSVRVRVHVCVAVCMCVYVCMTGYNWKTNRNVTLGHMHGLAIPFY